MIDVRRIEVRDAHRKLRQRDKDVLGFQVAMDDAHTMEGVYPECLTTKRRGGGVTLVSMIDECYVCTLQAARPRPNIRTNRTKRAAHNQSSSLCRESRTSLLITVGTNLEST